MQHEEHQEINDALAANHACYILITLGAPNEEGKMEVEMTYKGDAGVASFLLQQAQAVVDEQAEASMEELSTSPSKVVELG
jgi:hypothetical protein